MNRIHQTSQTKTLSKKWFVLITIFWLLVWQFATMLIRNNILFASPLDTVQALLELIRTEAFWISVFSSFGKIALGFFLAAVIGILLAASSACSESIRLFLSVPIQFMKTVPVVSFIILALLWIPTKYLSILISFLMVLPVMYTNIQKGIDHTDILLLEMAKTYRIGFFHTLRYIYIPAVFPFFLSACSIGLGMCFKSGIAAEVIGLPSQSIGEALYEAKLYILTKELFAWTLVIIGISIGFEKCLLFLFRKLQNHILTTHIPKQERFSVSLSNHIPFPRSSNSLSTSNDSSKPLVQLTHIHKQFDSQIVLQDFSLTIYCKDKIACMGPSGIGKTTISRLLLGLLTEDSGTITTSTPYSVAAVFQENRLCMDADAITNVLFTAFPNAKTNQEKQLAILQIQSLFQQLDLNDYKNKPVSQLSGGMQRRVALARALLTNSELLLLDEPFKGLDSALKQKVMLVTKELSKHRTLFLITHEEAEAAFFECDIVQLKPPF